MSVSALLPVLLKTDGVSEVLFVDFSTMSVYDSSGAHASSEREEAVISEMRVQQESAMPKVPRDQINEVMRTERNLSKDNEKHIFRKGY